MKKTILFLCMAFVLSTSYGQLLKKDSGEGKEKKKKFNLMEKIGDVTGNLMTGKTETLEGVVVKANYINGLYSTDIETTEAKYFPPGAREGDYVVFISFFKNEGVGMYELADGEVLADGEPMEYYGLGSYGRFYNYPPAGPIKIDITAKNGDKAHYTFQPIPDVEILSVNGETALPILDLSEDITLEYYNPPGSEGTTIKVSMLTKVMGVRAFNHFADFKVTKPGKVKVTIPKEALANPEIAGDLNMGNFDKGDNYLILEREVKKVKEDFGTDQSPGKVIATELYTRNYASFPVIVKGKQDEGVMTVLRVRAETPDKTLGYAFYKPNATYGIPLSKASKFGLVSFTMEASTYKREVETDSKSWTVGNTKYTQTTTTTTTYEFPQLSDETWNTALDQIYQEVVAFFKSEYNVEFVPVAAVTGTPQYNDLFAAADKNNAKRVMKSYNGTKRSTPGTIGEILGSTSSNITTDNPRVNMMKAAGDIDGLLSMHINLMVGGNKDGNVVLYPSFTISISGRDETRDDREGKYFDGQITRKTGESFNESKLKSDPNELARVCSMPVILDALKAGITTMRAKEIEMGYDKIWNISEE
ncbi:hypothetical protein SAMN04488028_102401 [Reichenbachiella agariperforans]|uniref:Uncharacterized protein n=1 Tax=Reichenbachiella agariperforans TaxID=156994 RepID=A0A1M6NTH2_REIAG|nr:hypothetical protein [Reichenbachiella agariperforans]SHJ99021.1 hypothetical protein SAMN04488028_102401 [Reichenbachiella agariperforans]